MIQKTGFGNFLNVCKEQFTGHCVQGNTSLYITFRLKAINLLQTMALLYTY